MLSLKNILNGLSEKKINRIVEDDIRGGWNKGNGKCSYMHSSSSSSKSSKKKRKKKKKSYKKSSKSSS